MCHKYTIRVLTAFIAIAWLALPTFAVPADIPPNNSYRPNHDQKIQKSNPTSKSSNINSEKSKLNLEVKNRLINLHAENVNFKEILRELEKKAGIKVAIFKGVTDKKVSLNVKSLPIYAASTILKEMALKNFAVAYDDKLASLAIYILPEGKDISKITKGKPIIRHVSIPSRKTIDTVKGRQIVSITKGKNKIPIRYVQDEVLLKFHLGVSKEEIREILKKHNLVEVTDDTLSKIGYIKVRIADGRDPIGVIKEIGKEYKLKIPEPNYIINTLTISDPFYSDQWYIPDTNFDKAWQNVKRKNTIRVGVIDSGVDAKHPDLKGKVLDGYNFVEDNPDGSDVHGHGTFVAGIIAATANNIGIKGLYDYAQVIPVKVIDENGLGTYEDAAKGIIYAADNGAKVINLSIGGYAYSAMLQDAVDYALERGCIVAAAGGNDGIEQAIYPAAYPDVIGVSGLGYDGEIWINSNSGSHIDVSTPGVNIISTGVDESYSFVSGTSGASAMVSALAAMLVSEKPDLSNSLIHRLITQSAKDLGENGKDKIYGAGEIDAESALVQEVEPFHDVAVRSIHIEPMVFEKGKPTYVVANIENAGTYASEKCDVILYKMIGEEKHEIGRKKDVALIDRTKVIFEWKPLRLEKNVKFEILILSEDDTSTENNSKASPLYLIREADGLYILHKVETPVHQWIAGQAYNLLPSGTMKSEIYDYIGSETTISVDGHSVPGFSETKQIIKGAKDEDDGINWLEHFWDEDLGPTAGGLDLPGFSPERSAYQRALEYWNDAVSAYTSGNKVGAYYKLGGIAHLLTDMSVPAHVLNDQHLSGDRYEGYMAEWNDDYANRFNYHQWTSTGLTLVKYSALLSQFENLADTADEYESDDYDGEDPAHYEGHNSEWVGLIKYDTSYAECFNHGNILMPLAIRYVAGLYKMFWDETHPDLTSSATVSTSYPPGQTGVQIPVTVYRSGANLFESTYVHAKLYWSTNSTWDTGDTVLWSSNDSKPDFPNNTLNSSGSRTVTATINIPSVTSSGTYYIISYADAPTSSYRSGYHDEINENNNTASYGVTVLSISPPTIISPGTSSDTGFEISTTTPKFEWNNVSNAVRYGLYISKEPYGSSNIIYQNEQLTGTSFTIPSGELSNGVKYRWNMVAYNSAGQESAVSNDTLYFKVVTTPTLSYITISGSTQVNENSGAQYTCTAYYSDGSSPNVTSSANWSENSTYASICSSGGYLTTYLVSSDQSCTITATYGGKSDTRNVTIKNVAATLSYIKISGSTQVNESSGAQYTCTAYYSDGSSPNVTSSASWSENSTYATISSSGGYLTTYSVSSDQSCTITATYGGKSDSHGVTIKNVSQDVGSIRVSIVPQQATDAGAQWRVVGESSWRNSGTIKSNVQFATYTIEFKDISNWTPPPNKMVTVSSIQPDPWINSDPYTQICTYSISHENKSFDSFGGSDNVSVTTQNDCTWSAFSYDDWIIITSGNSGSGSGTVSYTVSRNSTTSVRMGNMTIAGEIFTVTQDGAPSCPDCSGSEVVLKNVTFPSGCDCECVGTKSITIGPGVTIKNGAKVIIKAPKVIIQSGFHAEDGSTVRIKQQ
ncbi:MAG: S8 family serine peptidase [Deltaproteobacteria bacterium]|nr:S8 family serine peptidase [Deltaproteobacteria bacterium]